MTCMFQSRISIYLWFLMILLSFNGKDSQSNYVCNFQFYQYIAFLSLCSLCFHQLHWFIYYRYISLELFVTLYNICTLSIYPSVHKQLKRHTEPFLRIPRILNDQSYLLMFKYNVCIEKGSDQLIVALYTLSIYPSIFKQLFWSCEPFLRHTFYMHNPRMNLFRKGP